MKLRLFIFALMLCLAGIAGAQNPPDCLRICPAGAGPDDEITITAYDEFGAKVDLSETAVVEMNWWPIAGGNIFPDDPEAGQEKSDQDPVRTLLLLRR